MRGFAGRQPHNARKSLKNNGQLRTTNMVMLCLRDLLLNLTTFCKGSSGLGSTGKASLSAPWRAPLSQAVDSMSPGHRHHGPQLLGNYCLCAFVRATQIPLDFLDCMIMPPQIRTAIEKFKILFREHLPTTTTTPTQHLSWLNPLKH